MTFHTFEDLKAWFLPELDKWKWFRNIDGLRHISFGDERASDISDKLENLKVQIQNFDLNKTIQSKTDLQTALDRLFRKCAIFSDDTRWHYASRIAEADAQEGARTICAFLCPAWGRGDAVHADRQIFAAAVNVALFERGSYKAPETAHVMSLQQSLEYWLSFRETVGNERAALLVEGRGILETLRAEIDGILARSREEVDTACKRLDDTQTGITTRTADFEKAVNEKLALKAPVTFWTARADALNRKAKTLIGWLLGAFAVSVISGFKFYPLVAQVPDASQKLWTIALILVAFGFIAWPLRLISRLYMSTVHMEADARERATLVETYIALLQEGHATPENRQLILAALFRPTQTGIVADDAAGTNMLDLAKLGAGK